ncbi:30S ribosomal protein S6 [Candidatus Cerribacteria bacterium 'Amazon FNV 2010 28 9']|uniref:Small ribosomal subunit protein bS6 n=1 Tax=Candidatus Cerribacteria bacterium 'Amazon FNV 2010 28 9' TaxID=2081795 RepID=A0A317JPT7_9BACT|nr:MAG: 30S ribosomal protein S6 [Candidatus Cerribacteria bacterium 'Amazon FNV 2010 28 9']
MVKTYELTVLVNPSYTPEEVKAVSNAIRKIITSVNGKVDKEENWGKKALSYLIKKEREALFLFFEISVDTQFAQKVEADVRLMDEVRRELFVIKEA